MSKAEDALELGSRRRIHEYLRARPGAYMREMVRGLAMPVGTLEYHLHYLVKHGLLSAREDGRYTRYYVVGDMGRREKDVMALVRQETPRRIATFLLLNPGAPHKDIHAQFPIAPSTLSFHLKKLVGAGIAKVEREGRENRYTVLEPDLVAKVLVTYRESFLDHVVDRFANVWLSLAPPGAGPEAGAEAREGPEVPPPLGGTTEHESRRSGGDDDRPEDAGDDARRRLDRDRTERE